MFQIWRCRYLKCNTTIWQQTSAQHKKVKYYNLSVSDEEKEETVLFLMDKFTIFLNRLNVKVYFHVFSNCFLPCFKLIKKLH